MMDETYLEVVGCLRAALVDLLGGDMEFKIADGFGMLFGDWIDFGTRECKRLGGGGGGGWRGQDPERTDGFKQVLPSDVDSHNCFCGIRNFSAHARFPI